MIFQWKGPAWNSPPTSWPTMAVLRAQFASVAAPLIFLRPNYALAKWESDAIDNAPSHEHSRPSSAAIEPSKHGPISRVRFKQWHGFCTEYAGKAATGAHYRDVSPPPPWKMAIVAGVAIYPLILIIPGSLSAITGDVPQWLGMLISTLFITPLMTWVVMPGLTRLLRGWLYKGQSRPGDQRSDGSPSPG